MVNLRNVLVTGQGSDGAHLTGRVTKAPAETRSPTTPRPHVRIVLVRPSGVRFEEMTPLRVVSSYELLRGDTPVFRPRPALLDLGQGFGNPVHKVDQSLRVGYNTGMPIISMFFGIVIQMFYKEHEPPHFHAEYQGQRGKFDLDGEMMVGSIRSPTALRLIREWTTLHRGDIQANWGKMKAGMPLERIAPLE